VWAFITNVKYLVVNVLKKVKKAWSES